MSGPGRIEDHFAIGVRLQQRKTLRKFVIESVAPDEDNIDAATFYVRGLTCGVPYGPSQPRSIQQLAKNYRVVAS